MSNSLPGCRGISQSRVHDLRNLCCDICSNNFCTNFMGTRYKDCLSIKAMFCNKLNYFLTDMKQGFLTTLCFVLGAVTSIASGYIGMRVAVYSNARTAVRFFLTCCRIRLFKLIFKGCSTILPLTPFIQFINDVIDM